jgi:hypothetical protein
MIKPYYGKMEFRKDMIKKHGTDYHMEKVNDIVWTTLMMAIKYACHSSTISCQVLPEEIIKAYGRTLSSDKRYAIANCSIYNFDILSEKWIKFIASMDEENHFKVDDMVCFKANGKTYVLDHYLDNPSEEKYLNI